MRQQVGSPVPGREWRVKTPICGHSCAEALRPLLNNPNLKVFSTLVIDAAAALDLVK
jgi:hypothetical protein